MDKIKLDSKRLVIYRKWLKMTQDDLAAAIDQSTRTIQRMESEDIETKLSFREFSILNRALRNWPDQLWGQLPNYHYIYPSPITGADQFARIILFSMTDEIHFKHIPDDPEIEQAMLELEKIVHDHKNKKENLEQIVRVRNLYRILTSPHKTDRLSFFFYQWRLAHFHFEPMDKTSTASWVPHVSILGQKPDIDDPKKLIKETTVDVNIDYHPETGEVVGYLHYVEPVEEEIYKRTILDGRSLPNIKDEEKEAQPFEQISKITEETKNTGEEVKVKNSEKK